MFRKYGLLGILLILFVELNFYLRIEPFAHWYFQIIWFSYILVVDALVYNIKQRSLLMNNRKNFLVLCLISAVFWWIFELMNYQVGNWTYGTTGAQGLALNPVRATIAFATVLPAIVETMHLLEALHLFHHQPLKKHIPISKTLLYGCISAGILSFILFSLFPSIGFPLLWLAFFLLLDPINYLHGQPSILKHLKQGNWTFVILLGLAGLICGFFWEFWNYWSTNKWFYHIPYVGFWKIFEMPLLGYLGYPPFALELYAMWHFIQSLHVPTPIKTFFQRFNHRRNI
ncbi:MAG: hypothetical protein Q7R96_06730 [Nanoarchaeota archaeon]|nr:hypothetical protein [Nanoarchaeota archaeon]